MAFDREPTGVSRYNQQRNPDTYLAVIADRTRSIDGPPVRPQAVLPSGHDAT